MGRPSSYTKERGDEIVELMTQMSMRKICKREGMPNITTLIDWQERDPEFASRCARARQIYIDSLVEETIDIADEAAPMTATGSTDSGAVQDKKVKISARQWYAEKLAAKKYGAKLAIGGAEDLPPLKGLSDDDLDARIQAKMEKLGVKD